jgi:hypothetical protein
MAHTPGPWVFRDPEGDELHEIYAESGRELICFPVWTHNQKANIPLIAAAPELLAALKGAKDELIVLYEECYPNDEDDNDVTAAIDMAIAAIAKAEGRMSDDNEV